jgi:hypothetical protein
MPRFEQVNMDNSRTAELYEAGAARGDENAKKALMWATLMHSMQNTAICPNASIRKLMTMASIETFYRLLETYETAEFCERSFKPTFEAMDRDIDDIFANKKFGE